MDWSSVYSYDNDENNVKKTMMDRQCDADLTHEFPFGVLSHIRTDSNQTVVENVLKRKLCLTNLVQKLYLLLTRKGTNR